MEKAEIRAAVIEDYKDMRTTLKWILADGGIKVVGEAGDRILALALIPRLSTLGVEAVTLDGNFNEEDEDDDSGNTGREALALIRELYGDRIVVAAISSSNFTEKGAYQADLFFKKGIELSRLIDEIPKQIRALVEERREKR